MKSFIIKNNSSFENIFFFFSLFFLIYPILLTQRGLPSQSAPPSLSANLLEHAIFIAKVFFYASVEEFLYRAYFPSALKKRLSYAFKNVEESRLDVAACMSSNILFALAHLYLGVWNAIFAFISAMFFMWIYKKIKGGSIILAFFVICAIHASFNIASFYNKLL